MWEQVRATDSSGLDVGGRVIQLEIETMVLLWLINNGQSESIAGESPVVKRPFFDPLGGANANIIGGPPFFLRELLLLLRTFKSQWKVRRVRRLFAQ